MAVFHSKNAFLTESEMTDNARYVYDFLTARGWTPEAVCGMLGNMETESTINPGIWQNLDEGNTSLGYGLVQWTPATKYLEWCEDEGRTPSNMATALLRIEYEVENGLQYYPTDDYPETFKEFKISTNSPSYLANAFLRNYERPADQTQPARATQAEKWYTLLKDSSGDSEGSEGDSEDDSEGGSGGGSTVIKQKKLPLWLILAAARKR